MTQRIYYTEPYLVEFDARVLTVSPGENGRRLAVLDRTAFYPTSGGQPHDTGALGPARVIDVVDRDDGTIVHVVEGDLEPGNVRGRIDWDRRFEHMQQHTGQHVLSAAFEHLFDARTVSFHLGAASATIDLAKPIAPAEIARAESEANRIVWEDRPVHIRFVEAGEAAALPLRKEPVRGGTLRLIDVEGFDLSACGGTHVGRTGAIGIIVTGASERVRGGTRVEFRCGVRALDTFRDLRDSAGASARLLSALPAELPGAIERLQAEGRDLKRKLKDMQAALAAFEAERLATGAAVRDGIGVVTAVMPGWDAGGLMQIASHAVARPSFLVVLISAPEPASIVVARAADARVDCSVLLRKITERFGGKGGGRPDLAQGGGLCGSPDEIAAFAGALVTGQTTGR